MMSVLIDLVPAHLVCCPEERAINQFVIVLCVNGRLMQSDL